MADIIRALKDTPLPTLLLLIGVVMLSVGFGVRIKAVVDVDQINKTYAKILGTVFLMFGLVPYVSSFAPDVAGQPITARDPFLLYYLVAVPIVVGLYWAVLKVTDGETQLRAAKRTFMLVAALATVAVLWRAIDVYFYVYASTRSVPVGLYGRQSYLPYLALFGAGIMASIWVIYTNTRKPPNAANRSSLLEHFIWSCVYLAVCRLGWELIDYFAKAKIPSPQ